MVCSACEKDKFSNSFSSACVECPLGQIKNASAMCDKCIPGTYSDVTGRNCIACQYAFVEESGVTKCLTASASMQISAQSSIILVMIGVFVFYV